MYIQENLNAKLFLLKAAPAQNITIARYKTSFGIVWLRKALPHHSLWIYEPLRWLASILRVRALQPVPNFGGAGAIVREARRLFELNAAGIDVPELLALQDDALLFKDVTSCGDGQQLEQLLKRTNISSDLDRLFSASVAAIFSVHQANQYLSQAFARNIIVRPNGSISFVDFEDDPHEFMALPLCQARDWLCFIFSIATFMKDKNYLLGSVDILSKLIRQESRATQKSLLKVCQRLAWIRFLPLSMLGSDGRRVVAAGQCLAMLSTSLSADTTP